MPDDKMVFGIEFQTNAKKATKDIKELEKARQEVEKSQDKHNLSGVDKLNTTKKQIKLDKQAKAEQDKIARQKKEEARLQKEQQKAEEKAQKERAKEFNRRKKQIETEYKLKKFLDKQDKERLNTAKQLSNLALGVVSAGGVLKFLSNAFNAGREYSNSALTTNFDEKYLSTLAFSVKKYGGDLKSVTSDLQSWQTRLYTLQRTGMSDAVIQNVMMKFPQEFQKIFYGKDNRLVTDTKTILENIAKAMLGMSKEEAQLLGQELGISQSLVLLLRESGGDLAKVLEANKKQAEMDAETAKELQKAKEAFDKIEQEFKKSFISIAKELSPIVSNMPSWMIKLIADLGAVVILLTPLKMLSPILNALLTIKGFGFTIARMSLGLINKFKLGFTAGMLFSPTTLGEGSEVKPDLLNMTPQEREELEKLNVIEYARRNEDKIKSKKDFLRDNFNRISNNSPANLLPMAITEEYRASLNKYANNPWNAINMSAITSNGTAPNNTTSTNNNNSFNITINTSSEDNARDIAREVEMAVTKSLVQATGSDLSN